MTVPGVTAEWNCTRCGTTNRKLVAASTARTTDRCTHCGARHVIEPAARPVRWTAKAE
jgi:DNA-directed RNA polymerase subunit RPC12/RpoP